MLLHNVSRYLENTKLRHVAREECARLSRGRIDNQVFSVRTPHPPNTLIFHPYLAHLAVAAKDTFRYATLQLVTSLLFLSQINDYLS